MRIVVISGLPCTGKSKLVESLREVLPWQVLAKDEFKEILFDTLGHSDRIWSKQLSVAAYALMFSRANELIRCRHSFVIEGNFRYAEHEQKFRELFVSCQAILQVHCVASVAVLGERFMQRARSGSRHPGHVDLDSSDEIQRELRIERLTPLPIPGAVLECDTTVDWQDTIATTKQQILAWTQATISLPPLP